MDALKDAKSQLEQASNDIQSYQDLAAKIVEAQQVYDGLAEDAAYKEDLGQAIQNAQTALNDPNATIVDFNHANDALDLNIKLAQAKFRNAYEKIEAEEFTKFETDAHDSRIVNDGKNIGGVASEKSNVLLRCAGERCRRRPDSYPPWQPGRQGDRDIDLPGDRKQLEQLCGT